MKKEKIDLRRTNTGDDVETLINSSWEQKKIAQGYRYVQLMTEVVHTFVFASPKRQLEINEINKNYLTSKKISQ